MCEPSALVWFPFTSGAPLHEPISEMKAHIHTWGPTPPEPIRVIVTTHRLAFAV
jgi:hypothetical protein